MEENGFVLENNKTLLPYDLESSSLFSKQFQKLEKTKEIIGDSLQMTAGEKEFSFMFRYFIFKYSPKKKKKSSVVVLRKKKKNNVEVKYINKNI